MSLNHCPSFSCISHGEFVHGSNNFVHDVGGGLPYMRLLVGLLSLIADKACGKVLSLCVELGTGVSIRPSVSIFLYSCFPALWS